MCPFIKRCEKTFLASLVAGSPVIELCNSGFHCEYISPHENPTPKYFPPQVKDSFTIVASSSAYPHFGDDFTIVATGDDSDRPGNTVYFFCLKRNI